jgi:hypothetical protein
MTINLPILSGERNMSRELTSRSFLGFVNAHVPEGRLQRNAVSTARAVPKSPFRLLSDESGKARSEPDGKRKKVKG